MIIVTKPIIVSGANKRELFPTTFYLTCPVLVREIHLLESKGWIKKLQKRLAGDPLFHQRLLSSYRELRDYRAALVPSQHTDLLEQLNSLGTGGIRGSGIKCLHAHFAHHRALKGNPVGEVVADLLKDPEGEDCIQDCSRMLARDN